MKLSRQATKLLEQLQRLGDKGMLESQIVSGGMSAALNELLRAGLADMGAHPTVKDRRSGTPAAVVFYRKPA